MPRRETLYSLREYGNLLLAADRGRLAVAGVPVGRNAVSDWGPRERVAWMVAQEGWSGAAGRLREMAYGDDVELRDDARPLWFLLRDAWVYTFGGPP